MSPFPSRLATILGRCVGCFLSVYFWSVLFWCLCPFCFFTGAKLIIADSIAIAVTAVKDARVLSSPCSTVGQMTGEIASGTVQVCNFEAFLVHVSTHDIPPPFSGSVKSIASIVANFEALFSVIRSLNPSCMIVFSAILPRPVDHLHSWYRVQQVNHGLWSLCFRKSNVVFNSYIFFLFLLVYLCLSIFRWTAFISVSQGCLAFVRPFSRPCLSLT